LRLQVDVDLAQFDIINWNASPACAHLNVVAYGALRKMSLTVEIAATSPKKFAVLTTRHCKRHYVRQHQ
jgi:hypothetical protein